MANHPIFAPTFRGELSKVRKLLESDESLVAVRDAKNLTPLHVAASRGQHRVVQLLIDFGADVQGPSDNDAWTPLVFAAYRGHLDAVKVLFEYGTGVATSDENPIHFAGQRKHKEVCRFLVENGAIDDLVDSKEDDILHLFRAAYSYEPKIVEQILTRRPELVDSADRNGRTPLHEACTNGDTKTVRVLLRFGADISIRDKWNQTPSDRAESHRQHSVTNLLQKHEGNV